MGGIDRTWWEGGEEDKRTGEDRTEKEMAGEEWPEEDRRREERTGKETILTQGKRGHGIPGEERVGQDKL